jgi:hypothetical protein
MKQVNALTLTEYNKILTLLNPQKRPHIFWTTSKEARAMDKI